MVTTSTVYKCSSVFGPLWLIIGVKWRFSKVHIHLSFLCFVCMWTCGLDSTNSFINDGLSWVRIPSEASGSVLRCCRYIKLLFVGAFKHYIIMKFNTEDKELKQIQCDDGDVRGCTWPGGVAGLSRPRRVLLLRSRLVVTSGPVAESVWELQAQKDVMSSPEGNFQLLSSN